MQITRHLAGAVVGASLLLAACADGEAAAPPPPPVAGVDLVTYDGPRARFAYPESWDLRVTEGAEGRVRAELTEEPDGPLLAAVLLAWPTVHSDPDDFDRFVSFFGAEAGDDGVDDLVTEEIELPGASRALLQTSTISGGDDDAFVTGSAWTLLAAGEAGRNLLVTLIILDDAVEDPETLGEAIIASVEPADDWQE